MSGYKPGAQCLVVGAHAGFEENIGATLYLRSSKTCPCCCGSVGWWWERPSRPILVPDQVIFNGLVLTTYYAQEGALPLELLRQRHLMPLDDDNINQELRREKELELPPPVFNCRCVPEPVL